MKNNSRKHSSSTHAGDLSRRKFLIAGSVAATAVAVVPRHVLGGPGFVAPSQKVRVAYIGCGTQGLREMLGMLANPEIEIVTVCDPVKDSHDYVDWSKDGLRSEIAQAIKQPEWRKGRGGVPGGREVAQEIIHTYYSHERPEAKAKPCSAYADFRELLEKEKDLDAVKVMTPDHLHATVAIAAMKRGKHVMMHKPLANRLTESRLVIDVARVTKVATHFLPASEGTDIQTIKEWIDGGAIGTLREIHNWSNRPVWPQYAFVPTDRPPVPPDFDWSLWLGPSLDRPYHSHYTNAVFRGWYEFGGGAVADMGHYSLWPVFRFFDLDTPFAVESRPTHICALDGNVPHKVKNDYSFPASCTIRFQFAAKGPRPALDILWYDGSIKPPTPPELGDQELEAEGMLFVGDQGKILAGFLGEQPRIIPETKMHDFQAAKPSAGKEAQKERGNRRSEAISLWAAACKGGPATYGDFLLARPISDAFNLGAVSLRLGGRRLLFDSQAGKITNVPEANQYLSREYRKGWELPVAGA